MFQGGYVHGGMSRWPLNVPKVSLCHRLMRKEVPDDVEFETSLGPTITGVSNRSILVHHLLCRISFTRTLFTFTFSLLSVFQHFSGRISGLSIKVLWNVDVLYQVLRPLTQSLVALLWLLRCFLERQRAQLVLRPLPKHLWHHYGFTDLIFQWLFTSV